MALNQVDEPSMALRCPDEPLRGRAARDHGLQFKDSQVVCNGQHAVRGRGL
jgi:hypothetical protein